ncbi:MAG: hypothetical protein LBS74_08890 [Oscillospiraceae bacterium]|nr:hypothetical protein [Oscillospiraceae bacterium]
MDKDKIVNALNAIQSGEDSGKFHDELEVAISVLMETSEEVIAAVVRDIHEDDGNTVQKEE